MIPSDNRRFRRVSHSIRSFRYSSDLIRRRAIYRLHFWKIRARKKTYNRCKYKLMWKVNRAQRENPTHNWGLLASKVSGLNWRNSVECLRCGTNHYSKRSCDEIMMHKALK